jgi:hypothetical protein
MAELQEVAKTPTVHQAELLCFNCAVSMYHMSWDYHVVMTSLVPDYSTAFYMTSHNDSYCYRD